MVFWKKAQISSFIKFRPVVTQLFHADRPTDGRTGMTKIIVAFRNFTNALKDVKSSSDS
jgi:hypothetical protein